MLKTIVPQKANMATNQMLNYMCICINLYWSLEQRTQNRGKKVYRTHPLEPVAAYPAMCREVNSLFLEPGAAYPGSFHKIFPDFPRG